MSGYARHVPKVLRIAGWLLACTFLAARPCGAQTLDAETGAALRELAAQATVIFAGQVISVVHRGPHGASDDAQGLVEVTFHVDAAVRGTSDGATYILREWAGLWSGRAPRYVAGQRLLMLLAVPRDGHGLAAPVGGADGAIPLLASGAAPLLRNGAVPEDQTTASPKAQLTASLVPDLRWIRARAGRSASARPQNAALSSVLPMLTGAADAVR